MDLQSTPRPRFLRRKFVSPTASSPYRSPLTHSLPVKKIQPSIEHISLEELKMSVKELWQKNKALEEKIQILKNKGLKEEELKWFIDQFHRYNELKDIAQSVMGRLAILDQVTIKEIHEQFDMTEKD